MYAVHEKDWWGQDPTIEQCRRCGTPIQGGPMGMSKHVQTLHPHPAGSGQDGAS